MCTTLRSHCFINNIKRFINKLYYYYYYLLHSVKIEDFFPLYIKQTTNSQPNPCSFSNKCDINIGAFAAIFMRSYNSTLPVVRGFSMYWKLGKDLNLPV